MKVKKEASASGSGLREELEAYLATVGSPDFDPNHVETLLARLPKEDTDPVMEGYCEASALEALQLQRRSTSTRPLRLALIAAAILLVAVVVAGALGYGPAQFLLEAKDTITLHQNPGSNLTLPDNVESDYRTLQEALVANGITERLCPAWIPEDYTIATISTYQSDHWLRIYADFTAERGTLRVQITISNGADVVRKEEIAEGGYIYSHDGKEFYILPNTETTKACWQNDSTAFTMKGYITEKELERMIDSME